MRRFSALKVACAGALLIGGFLTVAHAAEPATSLAARVQAIEDRDAITRLLMEYGRSLDNRDFATYSSLFASNGEWIGSGNFGSYKGPAAIKAAMEKTFANAKDIPKGTNIHIMSNVIIDLHGDRATASSKWIFYTLDKAKPEGAIAGRYDDELIRENGTWKFLKRVAAAPVPVDKEPAK